MSEKTLVFVYGTLRPARPDVPEEETRFYPQIADAVRGSSPAHLPEAVLFDLGTYPAARPGQGVIHGDLLTVDPQALVVMDRLEGHPTFYRRELRTVVAEAETVEAWVYWAPEALARVGHPIASGDWFSRELPAPDAVPERAPAPPTPEEAALRRLLRRFSDARSTWLTTVRPDGRPHSAPVWHVWFQGRIYVVTTAGAVKVANIRYSPGVVISHPDTVSPVIIEGWAAAAPSRRAQVHGLFVEKYDWDIDGEAEYDTVIEITPTRMLAWGDWGKGRWRGPDLLRIRTP